MALGELSKFAELGDSGKCDLVFVCIERINDLSKFCEIARLECFVATYLLDTDSTCYRIDISNDS